MIQFKSKRPKLLYLHGMNEEVDFPGGGIIYKTLKKYFNIDMANLSSDPEQGIKDFGRIRFNEYDLVIGFSMGGVYACCQDITPVILINPGFGLSKVFPGFEEIDGPMQKSNVKIVKVFLGKKDKHLDFLLPGVKRHKLTNKIVWIDDCKHVPDENILKSKIIPVISDYFENPRNP